MGINAFLNCCNYGAHKAAVRSALKIKFNRQVCDKQLPEIVLETWDTLSGCMKSHPCYAADFAYSSGSNLRHVIYFTHTRSTEVGREADICAHKQIY